MRKVNFRAVAKIYEYEGLDLYAARFDRGLTLAELSIKCKKKNGGTLSPQRLCQFEKRGLHQIPQETKEILEKALG